MKKNLSTKIQGLFAFLFAASFITFLLSHDTVIVVLAIIGCIVFPVVIFEIDENRKYKKKGLE